MGKKMMDVGGALARASERLGGAGVDSPRLDAELLLAHVLDSSRSAILAHPERRLGSEAEARFRALVARRAAREPLAYLLGHREFFGLDFAVDPRVLVPRPETELLVEQALALARCLPSAPLVADVGAGSGAIAVSLAVHLPRATIYALDASAAALEVTAANARRHGVADRVHCLQGDLLSPLARPVDIVTANLPYVTGAELETLPPEIRDHEPRAALDGGRDGLDLVRRLLAMAGPYLNRGGAILLEIGAAQGQAASDLARACFPSAAVDLQQDYAGLDRLVVVRL
jgi:release factor glutamine methyltransferase